MRARTSNELKRPPSPSSSSSQQLPMKESHNVAPRLVTKANFVHRLRNEKLDETKIGFFRAGNCPTREIKPKIYQPSIYRACSIYCVNAINPPLKDSISRRRSSHFISRPVRLPKICDPFGWKLDEVDDSRLCWNRFTIEILHALDDGVSLWLSLWLSIGRKGESFGGNSRENHSWKSRDSRIPARKHAAGESRP